MGQMLCHVGDILVFGDVTADARPVLQGNCTTPIVLHLTRRFTVGVRDMQPYLRLMKQVVRRPWVWFVASNPFEKYFFSRLGVHLPEARTLLLRPVGASFLARLPEGAGQRAGRRVAVLDLRKADALGIKPWVTDAIAKNPDSWEQLMDWWHPDFRDGHILFDSWDELADILRGKGRFTPAFFQTKRATSRELMLASRRKSLAGFQSLYRRLRTQSCEYAKKPDLWPPKYTAQWARNLTGKEPFR
ncbi:hypothetical protein HYH03_014480 [Edaphochlamys debaryana]|uniref:Uncharacterized protein n=1 Tax=Edaphochlamys debaryana TaxID=47281 RepID=A0A835XN09_9CHLO|nr:hypothetical protein HYH03_014480 [Edaphochlamys debaryana]|eukprot:KAG2486886.1 hypothetical protein HYH03_014480 [Edaphochlamys debaryana]